MQVGQRFEGPGAPQRCGYKLLTLTMRTRYRRQERFKMDGLLTQTSAVRGHFRRFWRKTPWGRQIRDRITRRKRSRRDTGFILALEIGPSGNIHLHVLVFGEYVPQAFLQSLWSEIVGELAIVHVEAARDRAGALRYVLKYLLKGSGSTKPRPQDAAAVECALQGVRRVEIGGAFRMAAAKWSASQEDVSAAELMEAERGACGSCGTIGWWSWMGRVNRGEVARLGGFGFTGYQLPAFALWLLRRPAPGGS
jgi:hypothetical protein